jgi:uncharacterized protein (TIGR02001 family)
MNARAVGTYLSLLGGLVSSSPALAQSPSTPSMTSTTSTSPTPSPGPDEEARWRFSAALASDYRYRGLSLSNRRPSLQVAGAYDHPSGVYAGLQAGSVQASSVVARRVQLVPYAGYAGSLGVGQSWDIGIAYHTVHGKPKYRYPEAHVGYTDLRWGVRLSVAQHYYGLANTMYAEWNGNLPIRDQWRAFAHVGALVGLGGAAAPDSNSRARYDAQAGLAFDQDPWSVQLALDTSNIVAVANDFSFGQQQKRVAAVVSVSVAF